MNILILGDFAQHFDVLQKTAMEFHERGLRLANRSEAHRADLAWIVTPDGHLDAESCLLVGMLWGWNVPLFTPHRVQDFTLRMYIHRVRDIFEAVAQRHEARFFHRRRRERAEAQLSLDFPGILRPRRT